MKGILLQRQRAYSMKCHVFQDRISLDKIEEQSSYVEAWYAPASTNKIQVIFLLFQCIPSQKPQTPTLILQQVLLPAFNGRDYWQGQCFLRQHCRVLKMLRHNLESNRSTFESCIFYLQNLTVAKRFTSLNLNCLLCNLGIVRIGFIMQGFVRIR